MLQSCSGDYKLLYYLRIESLIVYVHFKNRVFSVLSIRKLYFSGYLGL